LPFVSWSPKRNQDEPLYQAIDLYRTGAWDEPIDLYQAAGAKTSQSINLYEAVGADAWDVGLHDGISLGLQHHRFAVGMQEIFFTLPFLMEMLHLYMPNQHCTKTPTSYLLAEMMTFGVEFTGDQELCKTR
jgi:hypothetical protein